jgi:catalase (peroxidase I)
MRALPIAISTIFVAAALAAASAGAVPMHLSGRTAASTSPAGYSLAVTRICAHALLFDHPHQMGTRADALEVARDIRASTARRLALVAAVPVPRKLQRLSRRWIASQRRLAASFARAWVQIYDAIEAAKTPAQLAALPHVLHELVHEPDPLRLVAGRLELKLHVPDCTGD